MAYSSSGDIPKIQLESREDVEYLQQQFDEILEQTLQSNAALRDAPMSREQRAEATALVLEQLRKWTGDMWALAGHSMTVNGFAYADAMQERARVEPLDESLKSEVAALRDEHDALLLAVSEQRRRVPAQIERLVADAVRRESRAAELTTKLRGLDGSGEQGDAGLPYIDERVNGEYARALALAQAVAAGAPATAEQLRLLADTVRDTQARAAGAAEDDRMVREILLPRAHGPGSAHQLLAYKAALHAITAEHE
ncbi:hypothetical protein LPJ63_003794 [Coemansia sp. RSA 2711]|nr:hypothetical protein LPJ63_003794 [Coemansia sp. RSA 2711]KAJ1839783.1 hypothetical protein LPJ70_004927 [Coemansia sp. RSA 2708]KAJ2304416.1 hypothetical protein IWW54_005407 [Coemansia sp. RSA 2705]KAJ2311387.1 hypothetical protein IWW52_005149 [Coemansia sp. RSA 2704]